MKAFNNKTLKHLLYTCIFLLVFIGLSFLVGCTPEGNKTRAEKRVARLVKKHSLAKSDTITKDTLLAVPVIHDSATIHVKSDSNKVDSLLNSFINKVSPKTLDSLRAGINDILTHAGDIDTTITTGKTKIHYKKQGQEIKLDVVATPDSIHAKIPITINTVKPPAVLTWYERQSLAVGKKVMGLGISIFLLFLLYFIYRAVKKFIMP